MSAEKSKTKPFKLPDDIFGSADVRRALRELEAVDDFFHQANLRTPGTPITPPKTTNSLNSLFEVNNSNVLNKRQRANVLEILKKLDSRAAAIHISFSAEPPPGFLKPIVIWARQNLHPYLLVNTGLQPSLIIGCSVRTQNKVFDLSLRKRFQSSKNILVQSIERASSSKADNAA